MVSKALVVAVLLSIGVAHAAPTTEEHGINNHPELYDKSYCLISYIWLWDNVKNDPGTPSKAKEDVRQRGIGIQRELTQLVLDAGHTVDEFTPFGDIMEEHMKQLSSADWMMIAHEIGCKQMTEKYSAYNLSL